MHGMSYIHCVKFDDISEWYGVCTTRNPSYLLCRSYFESAPYLIQNDAVQPSPATVWVGLLGSTKMSVLYTVEASRPSDSHIDLKIFLSSDGKESEVMPTWDDSTVDAARRIAHTIGGGKAANLE